MAKDSDYLKTLTSYKCDNAAQTYLHFYCSNFQKTQETYQSMQPPSFFRILKQSARISKISFECKIINSAAIAYKLQNLLTISLLALAIVGQNQMLPPTKYFSKNIKNFF